MIYSSACGYAIQAMTRLAMLRPDGYVLLDELCDNSNLPRHFVAKIFQSLVREGLLLSAKGRGGGFALARSAEEISVFDIVAAVDGTEHLDACVVGMNECRDETACPQHEAWKPIRKQIRGYLESTTLKQMGEALRRKHEKTGDPLPRLHRPSKPLVR